MKHLRLPALCFLFTAFAGCVGMNNKDQQAAPAGHVLAADTNNAGLRLPAGFGALTVAEDIGKPRHIVVNDNGDVFVKLANVKNGGGILMLRDSSGDGKADVRNAFGNFDGTGVGIYGGYLYASSDTSVDRYKLDANGQPTGGPETVIHGLLSRGEHEAKPFTFDTAGNIYVNIGAYSNACQEKDRTKGSPGMMPCKILDSAGGIWQFHADKLNQTYGDGVRYATGLRNVMGIAWNREQGKLYVMQHGRDQLHEFFPEYYSDQQSNDLPAECLFDLNKGDDCGWPYAYYDWQQKKSFLMPEYGGDGKKPADPKFKLPLLGFPGHMAPNGLLFYTGNMFPEKYRNGAFIAFHGSWNRSPVQKGFFVAFVPFANGKPAGDYEVFADGFAGSDNVSSPGDAKHRPCGLAQGPDGSLYVTDDAKGTVYRIIYKK